MLDAANPRHARALRRLEAEPVIWLTTVRPNGQAQTSPVWYLFEDGEFLVFSKAGTARTLAPEPSRWKVRTAAPCPCRTSSCRMASASGVRVFPSGNITRHAAADTG